MGWVPSAVLAIDDSPDVLLYSVPGEQLAELSVAIHPEIPTTVLVSGMLHVGPPGVAAYDIAPFISTNAGVSSVS